MFGAWQTTHAFNPLKNCFKYVALNAISIYPVSLFRALQCRYTPADRGPRGPDGPSRAKPVRKALYSRWRRHRGEGLLGPAVLPRRIRAFLRVTCSGVALKIIFLLFSASVPRDANPRPWSKLPFGNPTRETRAVQSRPIVRIPRVGILYSWFDRRHLTAFFANRRVRILTTVDAVSILDAVCIEICHSFTSSRL